MAKRKKPRSAAQKAATAKMLAANKRAKSAPKAKAAPTKKKPRSPAQKAATARMLAARAANPGPPAVITKRTARKSRKRSPKRTSAASAVGNSRTTTRDRKGF